MNKYISRVFAGALGLVLMFCLNACSTSSIMDMAILNLTVKAVDENNQPVANAIVESSDGQRVTTDENGVAKLKFSAIGAHQIKVLAQDRVPAAFSVSMPLDQGKLKTARLARAVEVSASVNANINANINLNIGGNFSAMMMGQIYPVLFQSMFSAYGYSMDMETYKEGEWTEWLLHSENEEPTLLRKAFLNKLDDKKEWWSLQMKGKSPDETMIMEVLFSANRDSIRRMRQKIGEEEASEVPVSENWYTQPTQLTEESLEGSVKQSNVKVTVAAGTFKADIMEFGTVATGGKIRFWRVKDVPGGVVRTEIIDDANNVVWWNELSAHGSGAKTELGSY